jgi:rubrerythrin
MKNAISRWILSRVIKSALVFEAEAIELYRGLQEKLDESPLRHGLEHLLDEEKLHWKLLRDTADGKLDPDELERALHEHLYARLPEIAPLSGKALSIWGDELRAALHREKETFIFYSNLRRISKIPAVKKAFEVLSDMEKEHVEILARLLGEAAPHFKPLAGR